MRDNAKSGALTESDLLYFTLSLYTKTTDTPLCSLLKKKRAGGFR